MSDESRDLLIASFNIIHYCLCCILQVLIGILDQSSIIFNSWNSVSYCSDFFENVRSSIDMISNDLDVISDCIVSVIDSFTHVLGICCHCLNDFLAILSWFVCYVYHIFAFIYYVWDWNETCLEEILRVVLDWLSLVLNYRVNRLVWNLNFTLILSDNVFSLSILFWLIVVLNLLFFHTRIIFYRLIVVH
jgi:hypothetical protein